jgi:predicted nucleic acid-binding protein
MRKELLIVHKKVFIDTAPFIYLLENNEKYFQKVADFLAEAAEGETTLITSVLTFMEFCTKPEELSREDLINDFEILLKDLHISVLDVTLENARLGYKLRAKYGFLKSIDALQMAIAVQADCQGFFTNDKKLKGARELEVVVVEEI